MAKDHFIPAAVLGMFSDGHEESLRRRRVAVQRHGRKPYIARAENIGYVNNLYDLDGQEAKTVDSSWSGYEHRLPEAISILEDSRPLEADVWLRVLVPYVTSLFVRGREWETRYQARFTDAWGPDIFTPPANPEDDHSGSIRGILTTGNANGSRLIELQRLLALVTCAQWNIVHSAPRQAILNNDLGLTGTLIPHTKEQGWVIPLLRKVAVRLFPRDRRRVVTWRKDRWFAIVDNDYLTSSGNTGLNRSIAAVARDFVVGPTIQSVTEVAHAFGKLPDHRPLMEAWPFTNKELRENQYHWYRLVSLTYTNEAPPRLLEDTDIETAIDWSGLAEGWMPQVVMLGNAPVRQLGLELHGRTIELTLRDSPVSPAPLSVMASLGLEAEFGNIDGLA